MKFLSKKNNTYLKIKCVKKKIFENQDAYGRNNEYKMSNDYLCRALYKNIFMS